MFPDIKFFWLFGGLYSYGNGSCAKLKYCVEVKLLLRAIGLNSEV